MSVLFLWMKHLRKCLQIWHKRCGDETETLYIQEGQKVNFTLTFYHSVINVLVFYSYFRTAKLRNSNLTGVQMYTAASWWFKSSYEPLSKGQKCVLWGQSDLRPPTSNEFTLESKRTLPDFKKFLISRSNEWRKRQKASEVVGGGIKMKK